MSLQANLSGTFTIGPTAGSTEAEVGNGGCQYGLSIRADNTAPNIENSQQQGSIDSSASFVALPVSSNMQGRLLFLRMDPNSAKVDLRVTFSSTGAVTMPVRGQVFIEADSTDHITLVEIQGVATFDWSLSGMKA